MLKDVYNRLLETALFKNSSNLYQHTFVLTHLLFFVKIKYCLVWLWCELKTWLRNDYWKKTYVLRLYTTNLPLRIIIDWFNNNLIYTSMSNGTIASIIWHDSYIKFQRLQFCQTFDMITTKRSGHSYVTKELFA